MCKPMIGILPEEYRKDHWPIIEKLLEKAIEQSQGEFDAHDIELGLEEKDYVLFGEILDGKHDDIPEQASYMVGPIEDVLAKAEQMTETE